MSLSRTNLTFALRGPTWISLDNPNPLPGSTGVCILNVLFQGAVNVSSICFKNYYTSTITIKYKTVEDDILLGSSGSDDVEGIPALPWKTFVNRQRLMPDADYEDASQNYFTITSEGKQSLSRVTSMVIILRQPSCKWKTFAINDLEIFGDSIYKTTNDNGDLLQEANEKKKQDDIEPWRNSKNFMVLKRIYNDVNTSF